MELSSGPILEVTMNTGYGHCERHTEGAEVRKEKGGLWGFVGRRGEREGRDCPRGGGRNSAEEMRKSAGCRGGDPNARRERPI